MNPAPVPRGRRSRRLALIAGVGVLTLLLGTGAALATLRFIAGGGPNPEVEGGEAAGALKVTGAPPTIRAWQDGYQEAWHVDPDEILALRELGGDEGPHDYAGRASELVLLTVDVATASGAVVGVHESDGESAWAGYSGEQCGGVVKDHLRCQGGRMGYYPTDLVDLGSGSSTTIPSSQELGARIPDGQEDYFWWDTFVIGGSLFAGWLDESSTEWAPRMRLARLADDGSAFTWQSEPVPISPDLNWSGMGALEPGRLHHGMVTVAWGAFDASNGEVIADGAGTDLPASVQWVAEDVLQGGHPSSTPEQVVAPDGATVSVIGAGGISVTTRALPKYPLRQTEDGVAAFDPATGADGLTGPTLWSANLGPSATGPSIREDGTNGDYLLAYRDGLIAVARQPSDSRTGVLSMLAEDTGSILWQASVVVPAKDGDRGVLAPIFSADGGLLVQTGSSGVGWGDVAELTMFDTENGEVRWIRPGAVAGGQVRLLNSAPFAPEVEELHGIVVDDLNGQSGETNGTYTMIRPARPTEPLAPPASAPPCPAGMTAIAWTRYPDGSILLCRADQQYAVVFPSHPDWRAAELTFSGGGHEVVFGNGVRVRVSLGGSVVYTETDQTVTATPADEAWNSTSGAVAFPVPSDLATCPAGSWPISLSTYDGGWLLVCGTADGTPASMVFADGSTVTPIGTVSLHGGGYCGTADIGTVCGYRSPAVVTVTDGGGAVVQHSAESNYFDGHGQGGSGQGTGSYGVEAPADNAEDQVRYLTEILQKSALGRANLQSAVDRVRACTDVTGALASFNEVLANRQELLDALDSTPVDAVPDGADLVAKLRTALSLSYDSDRIWLQWAQAEQANGCAEGEDNPLYRQVREMNADVATAKDRFVAAWNDEIVPAYRAPRFETSQI